MQRVILLILYGITLSSTTWAITTTKEASLNQSFSTPTLKKTTEKDTKEQKTTQTKRNILISALTTLGVFTGTVILVLLSKKESNNSLKGQDTQNEGASDEDTQENESKITQKGVENKSVEQDDLELKSEVSQKREDDKQASGLPKKQAPSSPFEAFIEKHKKEIIPQLRKKKKKYFLLENKDENFTEKEAEVMWEKHPFHAVAILNNEQLAKRLMNEFKFDGYGSMSIMIPIFLLDPKKFSIQPIHLGAHYDSFEVVQLIIENHPDLSGALNSLDSDQNNPLHHAAEGGSLRIGKLLLESQNGDRKLNIDARQGSGYTALQVATRSNNIDFVKFLLEKKADPKLNDPFAPSALHIAASENYYQIVQLLLKNEHNQVPPNIKDNKGTTPLHMAAESGSFEAAKCLVENKANVNASTTRSRSTPLHHAALGDSPGCKKVGELLVKNGAIIEAEDKDKKRPIDLALQIVTSSGIKTNLELAKYLISIMRKEDINKKVGEGERTLLDIAESKVRWEKELYRPIVELLKSKGAVSQ